MEKIVNKIINESVKDADIYYSNGSTWIIFTDNKQWVIELTENKTLWYNYNFFKNLFNYLSLDVVGNQQYITKWVEDNFINKVKDTVTANNHIFDRVEDAIQNGIKETKYNQTFQEPKFRDALQNGVKETITSENRSWLTAENIIENGKLISETFVGGIEQIGNVNTVLNCGIKEAQPLPSQEGNKDWGIYYHGKEDRTKPHTEYVDEVIKTGLIKTFNG